MGLFSKDKEAQNYKKEKSAYYYGTTMQQIGVIPKGEEIEIKLNPKERVLIIIDTDDNRVTLPYDRIRGFSVDYVTEEKINQDPNLAALILSAGLFGKVGKIAGGIMSNKKKKKIVWMGILRYEDKAGIEKELAFSGEEESIDADEKPWKEESDKEFEMVVNRIANNDMNDLYEL